MKRNIPENYWTSMLYAFFAFLVQSVCLFFYLEGVLNIFFFLISYVVVFAILLKYLFKTSKDREDLGYPLLLVLSAAGGGSFGLAAYLLIAVFRPIYTLFNIPQEEWFLELFPKREINPFMEIFQRTRSGWDNYSQLSEVTSFKEVFAHGTTSQKQGVLDAIAKDFHTGYAAILQEALSNPHNIIRIQAAAIISKIESDYEMKLRSIHRKIKENPDDPEIEINLARYYDEFLSSGLLDGLRQKEVGSMALKHYLSHLKNHPEDSKSSFAIGRLLFQVGQYENFISWFQDYEASNKTPPEIIRSWYLESLYKLKRYDHLMDVVER